MRQARQIIGQRRGDLQILLGGFGHQFRKPEIAEDALAPSAHGRASGEGHERHAHPEPIAGRDPAPVRKRIQGNVEALQGLQITLPRLHPDKLQTFLGNTAA